MNEWMNEWMKVITTTCYCHRSCCLPYEYVRFRTTSYFSKTPPIYMHTEHTSFQRLIFSQGNYSEVKFLTIAVLQIFCRISKRKNWKFENWPICCEDTDKYLLPCCIVTVGFRLHVISWCTHVYAVSVCGIRCSSSSPGCLYAEEALIWTADEVCSFSAFCVISSFTLHNHNRNFFSFSTAEMCILLSFFISRLW